MPMLERQAQPPPHDTTQAAIDEIRAALSYVEPPDADAAVDPARPEQAEAVDAEPPTQSFGPFGHGKIRLHRH